MARGLLNLGLGVWRASLSPILPNVLTSGLLGKSVDVNHARAITHKCSSNSSSQPKARSAPRWTATGLAAEMKGVEWRKKKIWKLRRVS